MGQVLHKCTKTTHIIRQEIIASPLPARVMAKQLGLNVKTVSQWHQRQDVHDKPMGNGRANSVLTPEEEYLIVEVRTKSWLPLDDLLKLLKPNIPKLTRSNLHLYLQSLAHFLNDYHGQKKLKALEHLTPYKFILDQWRENPQIFHKNPCHCVGLKR